MQDSDTLHFPAASLQTGYNHICDPTNSPLRWLHFGRIWLPSAGDRWTHDEEIYFFLIQPQTGFGIQYLYDPPQRAERIDSVIVVRDGDAVVIPHGYHPVVGLPGYQLYYLWVLCGEVGERSYGQFSTDPDHAWLLNVEPLIDQ